MTTVTPSTSVILVDTKSGLSPYIVYFPYINTPGRIITIRDNEGYASTGNSVLLSTTGGATFPDNQSTISINQRFGFITLCSEPNGHYSILNTFAFPTGSESAYVYNINTNNIGINDNSTNTYTSITASTGTLYYGTSTIGDVTSYQLNSNISYIETKFTNTLNSSLVVRRYITLGNSGTPNNPLGSIQYSDNSTTWNNALGGTQGFSNGGIDVIITNTNIYVACGNNYDITNPANLGYLQWSIDGLIWNNSISPALSLATLPSKVCYANGVWHAVGLGVDSSAILWSIDAKTWNPSVDTTNMFQSPGFTSIVYGRNIWVACGNNSYHSAFSLIYSTDGSNWNPNTTINTILNPFYDVTFTGSNFIAIAGNSGLTGNIVISTSGSNDSLIVPVNLNNEPGYVANNGTIVLVVTPTYHKYSIDYGYTWNDMPDFPIGVSGRPYYDGSVWWVPINSGTTSNLYYSTSGSNLWTTQYLSGTFPLGYPIGIASINVSSNLNLQLISTLTGVESNFQTSSFSVGYISTGSFTIVNTSNIDNDILSISSFNNNAFVMINNLSTNYIYSSSVYTNSLDVVTLNVSTLNISTIYASDTIYASSFVSNYVNTSTLNFSSIYMSSMFVNDLSTNNINVSSISSGIVMLDTLTANIVYSDIVSTNSLVLSTINLYDSSSGNLTDINASNGNLYFQNQKLLTSIGTNPLFFTYQLQDNSTPAPGAIPGSTGFFTVDTADLLTISVINFSVTDYYNIALIGLFNKMGIYSVLHIINATTLKDTIYLINSITQSASLSYYTLTLTHLVGTTALINVGDIYNFYVGNIGIKPPPSSPTDTIVVHAGILGTAFNFTSAYRVVPANIGIYSGGASGFSISLNNINYNIGNIPATVGSIVFYNGTSYVSINVKYSSINNSTGAYITVNGGINLLTVGGLTLTNFAASVDNNPSGPYAIYITIKFLN